MYQAVEYVWGKSTRVARPPFVRCVVFETPTERDEWIRNGSPFVNAPGHREPVTDRSRLDA